MTLGYVYMYMTMHLYIPARGRGRAAMMPWYMTYKLQVRVYVYDGAHLSDVYVCI